MTDPKTKKKLKAAMKVLLEASEEDKRDTFSELFVELEEKRAQLREVDNLFNPHSLRTERAFGNIVRLCRSLTGYNGGWVSEAFLEHLAKKTGRDKTYTPEQQAVNCYFIAAMQERGSSQTQAIKMVQRLRGDIAESSGRFRTILETYQDYKKAWPSFKPNLSVKDNAYEISRLLDFKYKKLIGKQAKSVDAVNALNQICSETIDFLRTHHALVAQHDAQYPSMYESILGLLDADYPEPHQYFWKHPLHKEHDRQTRQFALREFINSAALFAEGFETDENMPDLDAIQKQALKSLSKKS